jgi:hypothetical protein
LVEQIIRSIEGEIQRFFAECPNKEFKRVGSMSIFFNGDHYCLQIDARGRLETIYVNESTRRSKGKTEKTATPQRKDEIW